VDRTRYVRWLAMDATMAYASMCGSNGMWGLAVREIWIAFTQASGVPHLLCEPWGNQSAACEIEAKSLCWFSGLRKSSSLAPRRQNLQVPLAQLLVPLFTSIGHVGCWLLAKRWQLRDYGVESLKLWVQPAWKRDLIPSGPLEHGSQLSRLDQLPLIPHSLPSPGYQARPDGLLKYQHSNVNILAPFVLAGGAQETAEEEPARCHGPPEYRQIIPCGQTGSTGQVPGHRGPEGGGAESAAQRVHTSWWVLGGWVLAWQGAC
jgi:hypothetical protein